MGHRRLGKHLTQAHLNDAWDALEKQAALQHGRGVLRGCLLSPMGDTLRVRCEGGVVCVEAAREIAWEDDIPVPPNATSFVWRSEDGKTLVTDSPDPVGGLFVCVGRVTSHGHAVVSCDGVGRMEPARMDPDNPRSFVTRSEILPKGPLHNPVAERFIDDDLFLEPGDRNVQIVDPGATDRRVFLFDEPHFGNWFRIANNGEDADGDVIVCHGNTEIARLSPGHVLDVAVKPGARHKVTKAQKRARQDEAPNADARKAAKYKDRTRNEWFVVASAS